LFSRNGDAFRPRLDCYRESRRGKRLEQFEALYCQGKIDIDVILRLDGWVSNKLEL
jgi:hypothetical protein